MVPESCMIFREVEVKINFFARAGPWYATGIQGAGTHFADNHHDPQVDKTKIQPPMHSYALAILYGSTGREFDFTQHFGAME